MRCLSIRQPWAHAILHFGKRVENRRMVVGGTIKPPTWHAYRDPILLHASKGVGTRQEFSESAEAICGLLSSDAWDAFRDHHLDTTYYGDCDAWWTPQDSLRRGGIVGRARIVGMLPASPHEQTYPEGVDARWHARDQYGFVLADVEPLPFFPCKGKLGLWEFDEKLLKGSA